MSFDNHLCYFCDETYPYPSCFIENYNGIWICCNCERVIPINNIKQNEKCSVCLENNHLIKLSTCIHNVCFSCCKSIYFGATSNELPVNWKEISIETQYWPYKLNDYNETDYEHITYDEFEGINLDIKPKTKDELIIIRNNLIKDKERPKWMNIYEFYKKEREKYSKNKMKGNMSCPLCRKNI